MLSLKQLWNSVDGLGKGSLIALLLVFLGYTVFIVDLMLF